MSTTRVITGSVLGVGSANRLSAARWNVTTRIIWHRCSLYLLPG
ncbi:MAG: hypothetical protein HYX87_05360 [Chloroflexi bacterium]|nr:hypothetical protein [Chloroflexota bacterium]